VVICLERGADCLRMVQLMPLHRKSPSSLASFKSRLVLPFWYRLSQVVLGKCVCVFVGLGSFMFWVTQELFKVNHSLTVAVVGELILW